ncbi:MAG: DUF2807 domain-containing protein [Crocinitomicaceae bacterium]|nr:DUF2807 domain-containing protein [Crocinitomicaceae bacterium]
MKTPILLLAFVFTLIGCQAIEPSQNITSKKYSLSDFQKIDVSGAMEIDISFSDKQEVMIDAPENFHQNMRVSVSSGQLKLGMKSGKYKMKDASIKVHIKMKKLDGVRISGASSITLNDNYQGEKLDINLSGAGFFEGSVDLASTSIEMSGAGNAKLKGKVKRANVELSGASSLSASKLTTDNLSIDLSGASNAKIDVKSNLNATASGASSLSYSGSPTVSKKNASGTSSISN